MDTREHVEDQRNEVIVHVTNITERLMMRIIVVGRRTFIMTEQQMLDREKKIAEIREALEKATPGPWKWINPRRYARKALVSKRNEHTYCEIMNFGASTPYCEVPGKEPNDADAHLIANAPEWLRFLLDELERR